MNFLAILSTLVRLAGFAQWADKLWEVYQAKIQAKKVSDAESSINKQSDDDVVSELHTKYDRD